MMRHVFATLLHMLYAPCQQDLINQPTALVATYTYDVVTCSTVL